MPKIGWLCEAWLTTAAAVPARSGSGPPAPLWDPWSTWRWKDGWQPLHLWRLEFQLARFVKSMLPTWMGGFCYMKCWGIVLSVVVISAFAYLGAKRGSYQASYYWARIAEERNAKKDAELEQMQKKDAAELRSMMAKGLDSESKERWDKYDQCLKLGSIKAGQADSSEQVLSVFMPTWMQFCLTGTADKKEKPNASSSEPQ